MSLMVLLLLLAIDVVGFLEKPLLLLFFLFYSADVQGGGGLFYEVFVSTSVVRAADVGGARLSVWSHIVVIV